MCEVKVGFYIYRNNTILYFFDSRSVQENRILYIGTIQFYIFCDPVYKKNVFINFTHILLTIRCCIFFYFYLSNLIIFFFIEVLFFYFFLKVTQTRVTKIKNGYKKYAIFCGTIIRIFCYLNLSEVTSNQLFIVFFCLKMKVFFL